MLQLCCNSAATGKLSYEWLSFAADSNTNSSFYADANTTDESEVVKVVRSASRHAGYVVENLRELRAQCRVIFIGLNSALIAP